MRLTLWPDAITPEDEADMGVYLKGDGQVAPVAEVNGRVTGFLEANIRAYADGCETRDVGYIEGWFVEAGYRRQGVGASLVRAAEEWARGQGCHEMGSDCHEDIAVCLRAHGALGYVEKERLVQFGKRL